MSEQLSARQPAFVREYLVDGNGTQAAIRAGYSKKTANEQASRLLAKNNIREAVAAGQQKIAEATETEAEWVRRRLREEATDYSEFASHSARIRALELLGKINGVFEKDNEQKGSPFAAMLGLLGGNVVGPVNEGADVADPDEDEDE